MTLGKALLCASAFSLSNGDNNGDPLIGLLLGLNEVKCGNAEQALCLNNDSLLLSSCFYVTGIVGLPPWLSNKESACNAGDTQESSSASGLGRSSGEGNGNSL